MPLTLIHAPATQPVVSPVPDSRDFQTLPQVQTQIIGAQNNAGHALIGATTGDLLYAVNSTTIGGTQGPLILGSGTQAAPTYSFSAETGLGFFRDQASVIGVSIGGVERARIIDGTSSINAVLSLSASWGIQWSAGGFTVGGPTSQDLALTRSAAGVLAVGDGSAVGNASATINCARYQAGGTGGVVNFGPAAVASITIKGGIVTAIS